MVKESRYGFIFYAGLICIYLVYAAALGASWQFDDHANLQGLSSVTDIPSIFEFASSGNAGPLGRPLSLLSFALQYPSWPTHPGDFIYVNILIHLINGCFIAWMGILISERIFESRQIYPALLAAFLWLAMPLLASSSLMVIQRMTTLSGTVTLIGLVLFLKLRLLPGWGSSLRIFSCGLIIVIFTILSALAKENGALFPVFCLALDLVSRNSKADNFPSKRLRIWRGTFLYFPTLIIFIYLATLIPYKMEIELSRGFSAIDRLLYELQALVIYLLNGFIPRVWSLGPFHDEIVISRDIGFYSRAALSAVFWMGAVWIAVATKSKYPELRFALIWYLGGHFLESTVVPLELYFEHRNYIPMVGVVMAITFFSYRFKEQINESLYYTLNAAYGLVFLLILYGQTSLWGNPSMAAIMWFQYNQNSPRAALNLAAKLEEAGSQDAAINILNDFYGKTLDPRAKFMEAILLCDKRGYIDPDNLNIDYSEAKYKAGFALWLASAFERLYANSQSKECEGLREPEIYATGLELLRISEVSYSTIAQHNINSILAAMAINKGEFNEAKRRLEDALGARFHLDTFDVALRVAQHTGDHAMANDLWSKVEKHRPRSLLKSYSWDKNLEKIKIFHQTLGHQ